MKLIVASTNMLLLNIILPSMSFVSYYQQSQVTTKLQMIKRNKQLDLLQKYNELNDDEDENNDKSLELSPREKKSKQDQILFDKLLNSESATLNHMNEYSEGEYLTKEQEEDELLAMVSQGGDRLFEGDEIKSKIFEDLVSIQTEKALGEMDLKRIMPWVKDAESDDYVILFCDPRPKNNDFRNMISSCYASYPRAMMSKVYFINADSPAENRKWVRKQSKQMAIPTSNILSDEKRQWMRSVTALGEKRWSSTMFIVAKGRIQSLVRDFDHEMLQTIVNNALKRYRDIL